MSREAFLNRVRVALRSGRPAAGAPHTPLPDGDGDGLAATGPPSTVDLIEQFAAAFQAVGGQLHRAASSAEVAAQVVDMARRRDAHSIVVTRHPEVIALPPALPASGAQVTVVGFPSGETPTRAQRDAQRAVMAQADMVVSGADYAIADTGTLVMVAGGHNPRAATLLPPLHVAVLDPSSLLPGMADFASHFKAEHLRSGHLDVSGVTFISGPSRTADIEQTLSVGVHGPGEVHVILLDRRAP